jgi:hypothetical protein
VIDGVHQEMPAHSVFEARERGLRGQGKIFGKTTGDKLEEGVVPQEGGIVAVFVAGDDLVETLAQEFDLGVKDQERMAGIREEAGEGIGELDLLVELADQQEAGIGDNGAAVEGGRQGGRFEERELKLGAKAYPFSSGWPYL